MSSMMDNMVKRFTKYISFDTASAPDGKSCPTTVKQMEFAKYLVQELRSLGCIDAAVDDNGYVMATLPAACGMENVPVLGLIAHMDTSPDACGGPVNWRIVENYSGGDIILNEGNDKTHGRKVILSLTQFPELADYVGQDIMVTDGTTLLGADDKAGICAIMSAVEYLMEHREIPHGKVRIGFTPDEEIGRGADRFDVAKFGADFAFTVDGGAVGELEYENFNAANVAIRINGRNVHTGEAKNKMINAINIAAEWQMMLPEDEKPENTEGYQGFYHVHTIKGGVSEVTMGMLIRDHDMTKFQQKKARLHEIAEVLNAKYGSGTVEVVSKDSYYNMKEKIESMMYIVDLAKKSMLEAGVTPKIQPIRGGTDGARLSYMGLPCPNIFTGGMNYHGIYEYLPLQSLKKSCETVLAIIKNTKSIIHKCG